MIVYRQWKRSQTKFGSNKFWTYEGWFLFGILPLFIRRLGVK